MAVTVAGGKLRRRPMLWLDHHSEVRGSGFCRALAIRAFGAVNGTDVAKLALACAGYAGRRLRRGAAA